VLRWPERLLVGGLLAGAWAAAAVALWPTDVPNDLVLPPVEERRLFGEAHLRETASFEAVLRWNTVASTLVVLLVLALYAWRGHRLARESAAGPIGTGMLLGMLGLGILWFTQIPFGLVELWWARRHDVADAGYVEWLLGYWLGLAGEFGFISLALLIVMGFARVLGGRWWVAGAPTFVALVAVFSFVLPWLVPGDRPVDDPRLREAAREFAREQGTTPVPVRIQDVHEYTDSPNAFAAGSGGSRRIFIWDTLLDGRFSDRQVEFVLAHEVAHHSREHILENIGWYALFAVPGTFLIALATRRRGTLAEARAVPLALFVFVALNVAAQPIVNALSRRAEVEADWVALETTRDPQASRGLFRTFSVEVLADPSPPRWSTILFATHPPMLDRIRMAEAWRLRER
jgi:STE24 endopeptidase